MASFLKNKLKSARDLIGKKDFDGARNAAQDVLSYEPENYNAYVTLQHVHNNEFLSLATDMFS